MTQKTESELLFEEFCADLKLPCARIPCSNDKTPDYDLTLGGELVVTEVKQLDPNDQERKFLKRARDCGSASEWTEPGRRVRGKLTSETRKQLKARTNGITPALLVVYDNRPLGGTDSTDIKTAMYGAETVRIWYDDDDVAVASGIFPGGGRSVSETCNTSLSAIGHLFKFNKVSFLYLYHNKFAKNPIDPNWFRDHRFRHFAIGSKTFEWESI